MTLILNGLPPLHWATAGLIIAAITLTLLLIGSRRLGLSTGLEDICSLALEQPYFQRSAVTSGRPWRLPFLIGLVLGGFLSAALGGGWHPTWALGMFDSVIGFGPAGKMAWMFVGGVFIGFGTRLANGCTSGHGIFGISNFEMPSVVAAATFFGSGILTTQLIYHLFFH